MKVTKDNNLAIKRPDLVKQWHPTLNETLTPDQVTPGSNKKVWWQCLKNPKHEWQATVHSRTNVHGCPYCSGQRPSEDYNLAIKRPDLANE